MSKKTLQLRKAGSLPREVYFQCMWIVKDIERLNRIAAHRHEADSSPEEIVLFMDAADSLLSEPVIDEAQRKLDCIKRASLEIPAEYRKIILDNISGQTVNYDTVHLHTINQWKQRFIYSLARNLRLY